MGCGRSGGALVCMAAGFGMDIRDYDPCLDGHGWPGGSVKPVRALAEGLAWADVVSVNLPKADSPILGAAEIAAMKRGAILVNTARGGIIDEAALVEAVRSGHIGAAGLDVFDDEPPLRGNPLLALDQVILTPHIAGLSRESAERMAISSVQNVLDFLAGRLDPALIVNKDALE